jgi:ABC-type nitrate/sulfonate/bicarbonate transport system substrate-binding protein
MAAVTLGFKAFDAHELLCHFVAVKSGLYKKNKLQVDLVDITFIPETELPVHWFQASCGAALASAVKGIPQRVVFVATDKPMFWIYAGPAVKSVSELRNKRLATFPAIAPPHHLANIILAGAGLNVSDEVSLHGARDDAARLGLLRGGYVDAAVISSALAPAKLTALGFNALCFFGDKIRVPTTGLGVDQQYLDKESELAQLLVDTHKASLLLIHKDSGLVAQVLRDYFDVATEHAEATARLYQSCYSKDGKTTADIAQVAINGLANSLHISTPIPWEQVFQFQGVAVDSPTLE